MKIAVFSDIHSNLEALAAALSEIEKRGAEAIYCLGDIVGYGADAARCVDIVREVCTRAVLGNHDLAVATGRGLKVLPPDGRAAARHNHDQLSPEQRAWLASLPLKVKENGCTFAHATPEHPEAWYRVDSYIVAQAQFMHFDTDVCFVGHTHNPAVMADRLGVLQVRPGNRYLINVGSVGQPRDQNPRLCLAFFDTEAFQYELLRVPYHVERAAAKIIEAGLPNRLAERLKVGQ